ncbi:MAG: hypothetical protein J6K39_01990 [Clostridia bacterium]|nr:hypothetical protein [Clostridia bacterium]
MTLKYKKIISTLLVFVVAVLTGFTIAKIYLDGNAGAAGSDKTLAELVEDESTILALYNDSQNKDVSEFSAMELWQIAEYNLSVVDYFKKEMIGSAISANQKLNIKSLREKKNGTITYEKLSPSVKAMGLIDTPKIATQMVFNLTTKITTVATGDFVKEGPTAEDLEVDFAAPSLTYDAASYESLFKALPNQMVMPYIISSKTCTEDNFSAVQDKGDGTYYFEITLKGHELLRDAALYYTEEICYSCGYASPSITWDNVTIKVTVDSSFRFKTVSYLENYTLFSPDPAMVIGKSAVVDDFTENFVYGDEATNSSFGEVT